MHADFETEGTFTHPNLIAGEYPRVERKITVASGNNLPAGTVLGRVTADGKMVAVDTTLTASGAHTPYAVLAHAVDASAGDAEGIAYLSGDFNEEALSYGGDDTILNHRDALRALNIYTQSNVGA